VQMSGDWYDIAGRPTSGLDTIEFNSILRQIVHQTLSTWGRPVARWMACAVNSHDTLLDVLQDSQPNRRIVAAMLLGKSAHLLHAGGRERVIQELVRKLDDSSQNEYGEWQGDEDTSVYVSATAAEALSLLGYAPDPVAVFDRARREGHQVSPRTNKYW